MHLPPYFTTFTLLLVISLISCSHTIKRQLSSNPEKLAASKTGILLTANLEINGNIKRGQQCKLILKKGHFKYFLKLEKGDTHYSLPLAPGLYQVDELNCGIFYYYQLNKDVAPFEVFQQKTSYLGQIDFELHPHGKLIWGHSHLDHQVLEENIATMGSTPSKVDISLLKFHEKKE